MNTVYEEYFGTTTRAARNIWRLREACNPFSRYGRRIRKEDPIIRALSDRKSTEKMMDVEEVLKREKRGRRNLYVIGPVSGYPDNNLDAFLECKEKLEARGNYNVSIPHEFVPCDSEWRDAMHISLAELLRFNGNGDRYYDGVVVLDGSFESKGAMLELNVAYGVGMPIGGAGDWLEIAPWLWFTGIPKEMYEDRRP